MYFDNDICGVIFSACIYGAIQICNMYCRWDCLNLGTSNSLYFEEYKVQINQKGKQNVVLCIRH